MSSTDAEGEWLVCLEPVAKAQFLSTLGHALTIAGRESYEVGGTGLTNPPYLREINEIQHRVLACLRGILNGTLNASFERSIAQWVLEPSDLSVREHTTHAWESAKAHVRANVA